MKFEEVVIDNPKKVNIDSDALKQKIEALKKQKEVIVSVYDDFTNNLSNFSEYWSGDTGDYISDDLKNYANKFITKTQALDNLIDFLQSVVDSYEAFDKYISNQAGYYV